MKSHPFFFSSLVEIVSLHLGGEKALVMSVMFTYCSALLTLFLRLCKSSGKRVLPACLKAVWRLRHILKGTAEETSRLLPQVSEIWVPPESFCESVK